MLRSNKCDWAAWMWEADSSPNHLPSFASTFWMLSVGCEWRHLNKRLFNPQASRVPAPHKILALSLRVAAFYVESLSTPLPLLFKFCFLLALYHVDTLGKSKGFRKCCMWRAWRKDVKMMQVMTLQINQCWEKDEVCLKNVNSRPCQRFYQDWLVWNTAQ